MIKILFLIHDLGGGGAEKVLVNLVNNMDYQEFDITVLSLFGGGINESYLSNRVHYKSVFSKTFPANSHLMKLLSPRRLHKLFVKEKYDIEIAYLEGPCARIISGCTEKHTKLVCWIHSKQFNRREASRSFCSFKEAKKVYEKFDKIVCVSKEVKYNFEKIFSTSNEPIVLYNTQDSDKIVKMAEKVVEDEEFRDKEVKICGVGKIVTNKGFDRLAKIHHKLIMEGYPVHVYILGDGPEKEHIKEFLNKRELDKSFTFLGYKNNPYKYIKKCDLFVCASHSEGFSTATMEALILGVPVITTNVSGMQEMLENGKYGIITDNDDEALYEGIKYLIDNPKKFKLFKNRAIERGKMFNTIHTVQATQNCLKDLWGENDDT